MTSRTPVVSVSSETTWKAYAEWNTRIANHFYSPQFAQRLAYLNVDDDTLSELSGLQQDSESAIAEFRSVVAKTLDRERTRHSLFSAHLARLRDWRTARTPEPPPCIALLGLFALVAERMSADEQFASHNYYGRLAHWLNIPAADQGDLIRDFRRDTILLWHTLNSWLESTKGERGLPTAYAFDHRRYVGLPISQSLLREADRSRLPDCFTSFGLRGGQRIAIGDMENILKDWIPIAQVSARLKRLWDQEQVRGRIAEIACLELEAWDDSTPGNALTAGGTALLLGAALHKLPRLRLEFALLARESGAVASGRFRLSQSRLENSSAVLEESVVSLTEAPIAGYLMVRASLRYDRILLAQVRLQSVIGSGRDLERKWKQVVVLRYDPEGKLYVEAKRIELAEDHIVLAHESIELSVRRYLEEVTGGGMQRLTSFDNPSIPAQWTAFLGVRVTGVGATDQEELQALIPIATTSILLEGGFRLPARSTWHLRCVPQVTVVSLSRKKYAVWLQPLPGTEDTAQEREDVPLGVFVSRGTWSLQGRALEAGDYRVIVAEAQNELSPVATAAMRLKCGDSPRHVDAAAVGHVPSDARWPLSAAEVALNLSGPVLRGGRLVNWPSIPLADDPNAVPPERAAPGETELVAQPAAETEQPDESGAPLQPPICAKRAHHYWVLPPADRAAPSWQELLGRCRDCGLERWFRPGRRSRFQRHRAVRFHRQTARAIPLALQSAPAELSGDDLLDALTYLQAGERREIAALLEPLDARIYIPDEIVRLFAALGHLDLCLSDDSSHISSWHVADPTLIQVAPGAAILTGARSKRVVEGIGADVIALGGSVSIEAQNPAPSRICITGLCESELHEVASSASKALGLSIVATPSPCAQLANTLPPLLHLVSALRVDRWPDLPAEYFDLPSRKWRATGHPSQPGAYRFGLAPRTYGLIDEDSIGRRVIALADHRTVKHLAGARLGQPLVAYSTTDQSLQVPLGADLPYMYERVAVLASGLAPQRRSDGIVHYSGVPQSIARRIWSLMGGSVRNRSREVACQTQ